MASSKENGLSFKIGVNLESLESGMNKAVEVVGKAVVDIGAALAKLGPANVKAFEEASEAFTEFGDKITERGKEIKETGESVFEAFKKLGEGFGEIQAVLAGGEAFEKSIDALKEQGEHVEALSGAFGLSASKATVLNTALTKLGIDQAGYAAIALSLRQKLLDNGTAFDQLGIATRDANKQILPTQALIANIVAKLDEYQAGLERNVMAQQLTGQSYEDLAKLAKLNDEALEEAAKSTAAYHEQLDPQRVKDYKAALIEANEALEGIQLAIGRAVMPKLAELGNWLGSDGPGATEVAIEAMSALGDAFDAVSEAVQAVWQIFSDACLGIQNICSAALGTDSQAVGALQFFVNVVKLIEVAFIGLRVGVELAVESIKAELAELGGRLVTFAQMAKHAFELDWNGVKQAWRDGMSSLDAIVEESQQRIVDIATRGRQDMVKALLPTEYPKPPAAKDEPSGHKSAVSLSGGSGKEMKAGPDTLSVLKAENDAALALDKEYQKENQAINEAAYKHGQIDLQRYYDTRTAIEQMGLQASIDAKTKERDAVAAAMKAAQGDAQEQAQLKTRRIALDGEIAVLQAQYASAGVAGQQAMTDALRAYNVQLEQSRIDKQQTDAKRDVDAQRAQLQQLKSLKAVSDADALAQETQFQQTLYDIDLKALQAKRKLAQDNGDAAEATQINKQIETLQQQHDKTMLDLAQQTAQQSNRLYVSMINGLDNMFATGLNRMMQGTLKFRDAFKQMWAQLGQMFAQQVSQMAAHWLSTEIAKTAATAMGVQTRTTTEQTGAAESMAANGAATSQNILNDSWQVASGVYKAIAGIPYVGPFLAPAMAVAAASTVSGYAGRIASASGGYDIPAGVNPLTQLHEKEMVLPAKYAEVIRGMAAGDGSGNAGKGGGGVTVHINAVDSNSVKRLFMDNGPALAKALQQHVRNNGSLR